jgi:opacity protein-like surface antigen
MKSLFRSALVHIIPAFAFFFSCCFCFSQQDGKAQLSLDEVAARINAMNAKLDALASERKLVRENKTLSAPAPPMRDTGSATSPVRGNKVQREFPESVPSDRPLASPEEAKNTSSLENDFGSYYLQIFGGYVIPSDVELSTDSLSFPGVIKSDSGYQFGVLAGRRFGNFMGELSLAYGEFGYDGFTPSVPNPMIPIVNISGESKLFDIGVKMSYGVPIGFHGWLYGGLGAGLGFRDDSLSRTIRITHMGRTLRQDPIPDVTDSGTVFSYNAFFGLGYALTDVYSARMGYRFMGTTENDRFGALSNHVLEAALGGSF